MTYKIISILALFVCFMFGIFLGDKIWEMINEKYEEKNDSGIVDSNLPPYEPVIVTSTKGIEVSECKFKVGDKVWQVYSSLGNYFVFTSRQIEEVSIHANYCFYKLNTGLTIQEQEGILIGEGGKFNFGNNYITLPKLVDQKTGNYFSVYYSSAD